MLTRTSKYRLVGERLAGAAGTLVDIGARDRVLASHLPAGWNYFSADADPGHDFRWNLELPLPCADGAYDAVVALDVLEHVENIHGAFREILRVARRKAFVSLPNMTCLSHRLHFLRTGNLGGKYDLLPRHQGDRHRWLTGYAQGRAFIEALAAEAGWRVERYDLLAGFGRMHALISRMPLPASLRAYLCLFELTRGAGG